MRNGQRGSVYKAHHAVGYFMVACEMVSVVVCIRLFVVLVILWWRAKWSAWKCV